MPTLENAKLIAEIFDTSLDYLLNISPNYVFEKENDYSPIYEQLLKDIHSLSPKSLEDLKAYIHFLQFRDKNM